MSGLYYLLDNNCRLCYIVHALEVK
uniref:Uncharacterized protein n=1 Tax=Arundo donax TaxID=35708 RepID=A0A0A9ELT8_ARUDO